MITDKKISNEKDLLNHEAYQDVIKCNKPNPLLFNNNYYMECYNFWKNLVGEKYFNKNKFNIGVSI